MTPLVRDFLRLAPGPYCIECLAAKVSLPPLEVRVALAELGNQLPSGEGQYAVADRTCVVCGLFRTTATFSPSAAERGAPPACSWCHEPILRGDGVATMRDGRVAKVHMRCLRHFRANRFDLP